MWAPAKGDFDGAVPHGDVERQAAGLAAAANLGVDQGNLHGTPATVPRHSSSGLGNVDFGLGSEIQLKVPDVVTRQLSIPTPVVDGPGTAAHPLDSMKTI